MNAVYIRVSTKDQNPEGQRAEVRAYLDRAGIKAKWFEDKETGTTLNRPGFNRLQQAVRAGQVKTVIVWKIDRIARTLYGGILAVSEWLAADVRLISITENFDFSGTWGQLIASLLFQFAEMERNTLRERQAAGIAVRKAAGGYAGRKPGTTKGKPARARELRAQGLTIEEITRAMGISESTVRRYLKPAG